MNQTVVFPIQNTTGITNPAELFTLSLELPAVGRALLQCLSVLASTTPICDAINCHVVATAYKRAFPSWFTMVTGYFGVPDVIVGQLVHHQHAWLVPTSAPGWVVDVAPFNGVLMPNIVNVGEPPWLGLYRPDPVVTHEFTDANQRALRVLAAFFAQLNEL